MRLTDHLLSCLVGATVAIFIMIEQSEDRIDELEASSSVLQSDLDAFHGEQSSTSVELHSLLLCLEMAEDMQQVRLCGGY